MNRRKFVGLFGGASAALSSPASSILDVFKKAESTNDVTPIVTAAPVAPDEGTGRYFPAQDYTPFGYLDNPKHTMISRSGLIRSVPPLGFGYWARVMPWPYGDGVLRPVNYLSFLHLSTTVNGVCLHQLENFKEQGVGIISKYHTKNLMSYDWAFNGLAFTIQYLFALEDEQQSASGLFSQCEDAIVARISVKNETHNETSVGFKATNIYGFHEVDWWGSDGVAARFDDRRGAAISKIWAYGDVFALGADRMPITKMATCSEDEWHHWVGDDDGAGNSGASGSLPGAIYTAQSYVLKIKPGATEILTLSLARGENQMKAMKTLERSIANFDRTRIARLKDDDAFYAQTPILSGDWKPEWKHGWIYDIETLRMTIRPPAGIYKHPWDGMQVGTPRQVLGETMLDALSLSYCDVQLVKEVILGTFADAPAPNVPCSREDGSMNMICSDGSEVGTAPTWGMPFSVIRSIYHRDKDDQWIKALYPHLAAFLDWWMENRTDKEGWFHCKCSWESGQDGSKRFIVAEGNAAAVSDFVRTADIEAAMADAFRSMILFSEVAGELKDREKWKKLAERRLETTRSMCVDGWFRDFDARTNQPIILKDYYDVMMLYPLAVRVATEDQMKAIAPRFQYFVDNAKFWLEWPSFMLPFSEAAWHSGQRELLGAVIVGTADRVYARTDARQTKPILVDESWPEESKRQLLSFPERYRYRAPGIANEFWPIDPENPGGGENYGWGATLPALIVRNLIGFREADDPAHAAFRLAPAFPNGMMQQGKVYGVTNLTYRRNRFNVEYEVVDNDLFEVRLSTAKHQSIQVKDDSGKLLAQISPAASKGACSFRLRNGEICTVWTA